MNNRYVTVGNGKQVHITNDNKKVLCGAARGANRGMVVAGQHLNPVNADHYDRIKAGNSKLTICKACEARA